MLEYVPWILRAWTADKDPRQFRFALVCNHCKISLDSLGSMRNHLEMCPEHKCPNLTCGHCAKRFDKWDVLAAHLNVPGRESMSTLLQAAACCFTVFSQLSESNEKVCLTSCW